MNSSDSSNQDFSTPSGGTRKRWTAYASATSAALVAPGMASASIVPIAPVTLIAGSFANTNLDLNGDMTTDGALNIFRFALFSTQTANANFNFGAAFGTISVGNFSGTTSLAGVGNFGIRSNPLASFINGGPLSTNVTQTLGVVLSGNQNAWIQIRLTATSGNPTLNAYDSLSILGGAYETTPGAPIQFGAVPEASELGLLALGAGGLLAHRRRRRKTA